MEDDKDKRIAALEEALAPFAHFAEAATTGMNLRAEVEKVSDDTPIYGINFYQLTIGHFRKAMEVMTKEKESKS